MKKFQGYFLNRIEFKKKNKIWALRPGERKGKFFGKKQTEKKRGNSKCQNFKITQSTNCLLHTGANDNRATVILTTNYKNDKFLFNYTKVNW